LIRVVLDTNVLVSGLLSEQGPPGLIVDLVFTGELKLAYDARLLAEYREILARPELKIDAVDAEELLRAIEETGETVAALPWPHRLPDPDDEIVLAVAEAAHATCVVTGNLRHFPRAQRGRVTVFSPREFVEWLRERPT
jgi:putative PIN family toxin of toxin-antitoxin system